MDHLSDFPEWEFLTTNSDDPLLYFPPQLPSPLFNPDHFSLHSPNSDFDRNSDHSSVAGESYLMKESSSPSSSPVNTVAVVDDVATRSTSELLLDDVTGGGGSGGGGGGLDSKEEVEELVERAPSVEEEEKEESRRVVWWKVPFEVFKYWFVRVSPVPVWSLSVAAFLGLVILGRRLYKMKRKTQALKLNVALDHKKVSQLMVRVARLNEAFSVVRHVHIVRPSVPASSVTLRPVMSMR